MSIDLHEVDSIFKRYGYQVKDKGDVRVYIIRQGIFWGVEIVSVCDSKRAEEIRDEYARSGYATRIHNFKDISEVEHYLFSGFFHVETVNKLLKKKYDDYVEKREMYIGGDYEYIPCPFRMFFENNDDSESIIDSLLNVLEAEGPQLILIEAAAGFGKTSTAYELLNNLLRININPIFAELSRNRQAKIFRYVLLDEIDRIYSHLNSGLVVSEIQSGRLPVIIDGFDELLQKSAKGFNSEAFEDVETMLETISELLEKNAKVILTSRRTAIFAGDEFHRWMEKSTSQFSIVRYKIDRPEVHKWIGGEKYKALIQAGVPIANLSNPVLLSFIRTMAEEKFNECCQDIDKLIDRYFENVLNREMSRQALHIPPVEQIRIFTQLAKDMVDLNITAEEKSFIGELIFDRFKDYLKEVRNHYPLSDRPSVEELVETLTNHALLDRVGIREDSIGFINQFIFGYLVGMSVIHSEKEWITNSFVNEQFISLATTAFRVRGQDARHALHSAIAFIEDALDDSLVMSIDIDLCRGYERHVKNANFGSLTIADSSFGEDCLIESSLFSECKFINTSFYAHSFVDVNFIDCTFSNCKLISSDEVIRGSRWFYNCEDFGVGLIDEMQHDKKVESEDGNLIGGDGLEVEVLRQFWPIGRPHAITTKKLRTLFAGFESSIKPYVSQAIEALQRKSLISIQGAYADLNKEQMNEIREMLGR